MTTGRSFEPWSDEDLARLAREHPDEPDGREAACVLLGRHARPVYRYCLGLVRNSDTAEDLAQDVLLSAWRNIDRFEGWGSFSAWIYVIARNRCRSALRRPSLTRDDDAEPEVLRDPRPGPDRELEEREGEEALLRLVRDHLTADEQEALWLRCIERLPVDEITRLLDVRHATGARALLQTARRKLRAVLEPGAEPQKGDADG